ncbi:metal-dependent hydrolase [Paracoccus caeni]|uniref:Metal-dependent hydrolase n=1 Tax=Paracoccus caeni TaxID=657651 RepID=A0A934SHU7_9RHOB|nr:metal-dependent hydrolase [Paracoccus caeni]MBK4217749.1 metal-dependent hydrolase [Paracoccus caeni]
MLIAHLPSGYLLGRATQARGAVMAAALFGSVAPDLDMIWFTFVDSSIHHHRFWPHIPGIWAMIAAVILPSTAILGRRWLPVAATFFAAILMHLILDTPTGGVMWLWPFSDQLFTLITVPPTQSHWALSFLLHWTFAAELAICAAALWLLIDKRGARRPGRV